MSAADDAARRVRLAARALGRANLAHAYGHCSLRIDSSRFLVTPPRPMSLVTDDDRMISVPIDGALPAEALGEVRIHQQIYRLRPDVCGIARFQSPRLMTLSALGRTPATYHGLGSYFAPQPPLWDNPALARDDVSASAIATRLHTCRAIVLRGNGAVAVGRTLEEAVVLAWFLEDAARVELEILSTGMTGREFTADEARSRAVSSGMLFERMWDWLVADDPARQPMAVLPVTDSGSQDRADDSALSIAKGINHVG